MKFLVIDDHALVRKGLLQILLEEFPLAEVAEIANGNEIFEEVMKHQWDVILLDISMQGKNSIEILKQIRSSGISTPILIVSMFPEELYAVRALKAGASGFINKESANEELLLAVHRVLTGHKYISTSISDKLAERVGANWKKSANEFLSDREIQILQLIAKGESVKEIAGQLSISPATVATYRVRALGKLGLKSNVELTQYAIHNNLIE
jgi:DNA-binding NarL/FixJ family response regulator